MIAKKLLLKRGKIILYFFLTLFCGNVLAQKDTSRSGANKQKIIISGTVRDNLNAILSGASIINMNTGKSILTNGSGSFSIEATQGDSLKATYIGYQDFVWRFFNNINQDVVLSAIPGSLNDVVVTGFGQRQKQMSIVGAVSSVNVAELQHPVANMSTMLAGRIAGLIGVQRSGLPGSNSADIWIRGIQSFGGNSTSPLIIIDGVQGRNIDNYDPEDIQSFTILKDASATAMYGSAGANGVILITTKRGSAAKTQIMGQYLEGYTNFTKIPKMADAGTYLTLKNEAQIASGIAPQYSQAYIDSTLSPTANHYVYPAVDWIKQVFNNHSINRKANVNATGGSESTQYYVSLDYYDETSMIKTDPTQKLYDASTIFQRYNFTSNVDMKWTKTTKFSISLSGYISEFNQPGAGATSAFSDAMQASPVLVPAYYPDNLRAGVARGSTSSPNPWADVAMSGYSNVYTSQINSAAVLQQDLGFWVKGLSASAQYSYDNEATSNNSRTMNRSVWYVNQVQPYNADGSLNFGPPQITGSDNLTFSQSNSSNRKNSFQALVNYERTFGEDHHVTAMLVYLQTSTIDPTQTSYLAYLPEHSQDYAGKVAYTYKNKYIFEFNLGYNGSEDYAPSKRFGWFPSPGIGWIVSNENFFKPLSNIFQYFKVRYSNGLAGAPGTGARYGYATLVTTGANGYTFGTAATNHSYNGVNISQYGANVTWAVAHTQDLGWDFHTLNDHLQFVLDYWYSHRTKVFLPRQDFPNYAGLQYQPVGNVGTVDASGFDGQVTLTPLTIGHNMTLGFNGTVTYSKNSVKKNALPPVKDPYQSPIGQYTNYVTGYIAEGLFTSYADIANSPDQSALGGNPRPGDIKYKDLNGDGAVNQFDQTKISDGDVPKWIFGAGFNFTWGNFYVSAFLQGNYGSYRTLSGVARSPFGGGSLGADDGNVYANVVDRWTPDDPNPHAFYPRLGFGSGANNNNGVASTWWVKDISFIRLKTVDVGYNIKNTKWMQSIGMKNLQIYFDGLNLCYWSPFKLWDPELNTGDGDVYPNTRNLSIGIRANF
ncbi:MAG: TonB-dependent receptor [Arachidicoccus sp.]|nr:TonB-dependent receptor [Arachidicoccus sp.]